MKAPNTFIKLACTAAFTAALFTACSSDESSAAGGGTEAGNAIANAVVSGVAQKGPFIAGSKVLVYELDGDSLRQTGKAFVGKTDKRGAFKINNIALASSYAILEGSGYFLNEMTGKKSAGPITLSAIADLSEREKVNINFLTQFEYDRVAYLISEKKMSVSEAKKQAESEILKTFFNEEESLEFADLDIFGSSEGDARLLAISVLALSDNSDGDLSELLAEFSMDIEKDGSFDNVELRSKMADYAAVYMDYEKVRQNVENMESTKAPAFEKYIQKFIANEYGLGECTKEKEGEIKQNSNKNSGRSNANFLCTDGNWEIVYYNPESKYGTFKDERDGSTYRTIKIGDLTWFAENLHYAPKSNGNQHCFNDEEGDQSYCDLYGYYYTQEEASCPEGWRLPDTTDWKNLFEAVGGSAHAAQKIRARGAWNGNAYPRTVKDKDDFGFSAMPTGVYGFGDEGHSGYYRVANEIYDPEGNPTGAAYVMSFHDGDSTWIGQVRTDVLIAVRCVKN